MLGGDVLGRSLATWAAEAAVDEAAAARARRHWLTVQAESTATVAGVLLDLGERGRSVQLGVGDVQVRGRIVGLGADFVVIERADGTAVLVAVAAVGLIRSIDDVAVWGDRDVRLDTTLAGIVGPIAAERPVVTATTDAGTVHGALRSAGDDVLRIRLEGGGTTWVPTGALRLLVLS